MNTLSGKTIISTRPEVENDRIKSLLQAKGARVLDFPMISTECVLLSDEIKTVLSDIQSYNWIVFTSKNGVICFCELLQQLGIDPQRLADKKFAVIGKATGEAMQSSIGTPALISRGRTAEDLLQEFQQQITSTDKVLLALAALADDKLEQGLTPLCDVTRIDVYQTYDVDYDTHPALDCISKNEYDLILFTSPSGYRNFHRITEKLEINELKAACIGTTTEAEMRRLGASPLLVSPQSDADSFANEIERYIASPGPSTGGEATESKK
ncbi:Uroporphyrinogen III synthase HEM4 [Paludibacter propionicigenes WB4]|uniref:Uroporphyrinogen-III synthase n=1 Tax=Paludibacter propionicigenes (strain DSM 17365 / JCM 13257 / WB4) TaxID=694427 RepID=E4T7M1_PALPW|nr:uroporphyrinogen-III synthase [Paludibacter propionicigenes]ADQ80715.1 Uroporphyrinogen III synthase HEM4 [Paludibacter propionicigenes WB4]